MMVTSDNESDNESDSEIRLPVYTPAPNQVTNYDDMIWLYNLYF